MMCLLPLPIGRRWRLRLPLLRTRESSVFDFGGRQTLRSFVFVSITAVHRIPLSGGRWTN